MNNKYVKSPINYLGNKNRMLDEIYNFFGTKEFDFLIEPFAGTGTVSINSNINNIYLNDINNYMIEFINIFIKNKPEVIIEHIEKVLIKYKLVFDEVNYNFKLLKQEYNDNFLKLRSDFNKDKNLYKLLSLIFYSFNNQIRFNSSGNYNIPIGKSIFNQNTRHKIINYCNKIKDKNISTYSLEYKNFIEKVLLIDLDKSKTLFYFDPPYLITNATYNDAWNEKTEFELLNLIKKLHKMNYKFVLSNVIESNGKKNIILSDWIKQNNFIFEYVNINYKNSNYQRKNVSNCKELLIKNFC